MVETSVVLLNYNGLHLLKKALPPLLKQSYKNYEVILVDNGSSDGSFEWAQKRFGKEKRLHIHHIMPNRGFTGGNNFGVSKSKGKFIVLLSNDTIVQKDWLGNLITGMKKNPDVGVGGSYVLTHGFAKYMKTLLHKKHQKGTMNILGESVFAKTSDKEIASGGLDTFYVGGNACCFRREICDEPFDPMYFIYAEDIYLCWKARLQGWKVKLFHEAQLAAGTAASKNLTKRVNKIAVFNGMKNQLLNYFLMYNGLNVFRLFPLLVLGQVGHMLYNPSSIFTKLKVYFWLLTHVPQILRARRKIQRERKVSDNEILLNLSCQYFGKNSLRVRSLIPKICVAVMGVVFKGYCWLTGVRTMDFL